MNNYIKYAYSIILVLFITFSMLLVITIASEIDEEEVQLPEPQGTCSSDSCSPATPCPEKDEMCYSSNGVFYCCVEPPFPGAEAVGN